ncbi:MAG: hypothetical protein GJU73_00200 [Ferrovum sp.]|jgi:signal transduction histidine kinase|nr:hypothetical protein [Ferrovum sp.]
MLTDLLDLSKISAGNFPTQAQFFSLDTAIAHICTEFDSIASETRSQATSFVPEATTSAANARQYP